MTVDKRAIEEQEVLKSKRFSSYKGKKVVRTNFSRSGSFGVLFIRRNLELNIEGIDEVRHEYGHTRQLERLGVWKYFWCIGIPSFFNWGSGEYYDKPWEVTADVYGGVESRIPDEDTVAAGFDYLERSERYGMFVWFKRV